VKKDKSYVRIGDFSNILIHSADHYDLYGDLISE
jgi:hypothetical protein